MKRVLTMAALGIAVSVFLVGWAYAGTQDGAVITLHAKTHTSKSKTVCVDWAPTVPCSQYATTWPLGVNADVYLVVAKAQVEAGIAGMSCGISYDGAAGSGADVFGWSLCGDLEFTNAGLLGEWPEAGGGTRITWSLVDACQRTVIEPDGVHAIAGAFYIFAYGPDVLQVTPNNNLQSEPELAVADCTASTTYLPVDGSAAGSVGFGQPGCNPCAENCGPPPIATTPTTWGKVKSLY